MLSSASRSVARRGGVWGLGIIMRPVIARPFAAAAVVVVVPAAVHRAATPGQIWLKLPPSVQVAGGRAAGSPFGGAVRSATWSASNGRAGDAPISELLKKLANAKSREHVAGVVEQLVGAGVLGKPKAMTIVLKVMGRNRLIEEAIALHRRMAAPDVFTYSVVVTACANAGDAGQALGVFAEMKAAGVPPNAVTFTTLIEACVGGRLRRRPGDAPAPTHVVLRDDDAREEDALGLRAGDRITLELGSAVDSRRTGYSHRTQKAVIVPAARLEALAPPELDMAFEFYGDMKAAGATPDCATFNALIDACGAHGYPDGVAFVFKAAVGLGHYTAAVESREHGSVGTVRSAIDLHGCSKLAAMEAVRRKLANLTARDLELGLGIITGKGLHSDSAPVVPAAVAELLSTNRYASLAAAVDPDNHGVVFIDPVRLAAWHAPQH